MKIGILTYHDGLNHGAFLQAFATFRFLTNAGYDVKIINYKNREHARMEGWRQLLRCRRPVRFVDYFRKKKAFRRDLENLNMTPYTTNPDDVKNMDFDVVIVGSDVIWNYQIFGFDDLYFGGIPAKRLIAYAASFGWVENIEPLQKKLLKGIKRFDDISSRDANTQKIVEKITGKKPPLVLDPTFLIDFSIYEERTVRVENLSAFILIYAYELRPVDVLKVKSYADENGLKCIAVGYRQSWCDLNLMDVGPYEWLSLYRKANLVVTSTFHGTIFAIKYRKPFVVSINQKNEARVSSLLSISGLTSRTFDHIKGKNIQFKNLAIDSIRIDECSLFSKEWLSEAVLGEKCSESDVEKKVNN